MGYQNMTIVLFSPFVTLQVNSKRLKKKYVKIECKKK